MAGPWVKRVDSRAWEALSAVSRIDREAFGEEGLTPSNCSLVAHIGKIFAIGEDSRLLGEAVVLGGIAEPRAFLFSLAVTIAARRRGLGRRILEHVIDDLARSGVGSLELTVEPGNLPALDLYEKKLGFVRVELVPDLLGPGRPRLILRRPIR